MTLGRVPLAVCGPYTVVAQQEGSLEELVDGSLRLRAEAPYLVRLGASPPPSSLAGVLEVPTGGSEGILRFGNFVGQSELGGRKLRVESNRLTGPQVEGMLDEVTVRLSSLAFSHGTPVSAGYERALLAGPEILYQSYAVLRDGMRAVGPHDVPAAVERILAQPHEALARTVKPATPIALVDRIEPATLLELIASPERLRSVPPDVPVARSPAAQALDGHLPTAVDTTHVVATTDTVENRFVVRVLSLMLDLVRRLQTAAHEHGGVGSVTNAAEAAVFERQVERWRRHPAIVDLPLSDLVPQASTVLRGRPGYRELTRFYLDLVYRTRPVQEGDAARLLELRDAATLYEYWCFFQVVEATRGIVSTEPELTPFRSTPFAAHMSHGYRANFDDAIVWFNRSFAAAPESQSPQLGRDSYSVRLRPDIVIKAKDGALHLFDAKFKRRIQSAFAEPSDDTEEEVSEVATFKRPDLYKMHAYRDALGARSVWVLYPGAPDSLDAYPAGWDEAPENSESPSGVGAVALVPGQPNAQLSKLVKRMLA